ncbi:hypothetical protein [Selenomonas sp. AE3005]|uniref:hypothetical protein n=1 Tax=Selenomonas sp. AE3005 TaxID=1485543 RepID=UPI0004842324|nr:hypothetical protein [Selenomonas sp. AE3005]
MKALVLMSDISIPVVIPKHYRAMLNALSHHFRYHVSQYTRYTDDYVLWHEEGCHHEYTLLSTKRLDDMLMAIEYLYHHRIGGKQIEWAPKGWILDKGYKALVNL